MSYLQNKEFIAFQAEGEYILWVKDAHRFIRMKDPAYQVFTQWIKYTDQATCTNLCISSYAIGKEEARKFVSDLYYEFNSIFKEINHHIDPFPVVCHLNILENMGNDYPQAEGYDFSTFKQEPFSGFPRSFYCRISNINIRFLFGDVYIEEYFKPQFKQFECTADSSYRQDGYQSEGVTGTEEKPNLIFTTFHLFRINGRYFFKIDQGIPLSFPEEDYEHFYVAIYTEIINLLYNKKLDNWMAVLHAAGAVFPNTWCNKLTLTKKQEIQALIPLQSESADGFHVLSEEVKMRSEAFIFMGPSGAGKSTIAALLLACGFRILSDDFLPVALPFARSAPESHNPTRESNGPSPCNIPMVYPLPAGICIKDNAIPYLSRWFVGKENESFLPLELDSQEIFLPLSEHSLVHSPVPAKAIFFIKYDPAVEFSLTRESNLEMMNDFLKQSWIANNTVAAQAFLDWYFSLPVYTLVYSDAEQMVEGLKNLV